MDVQSKLELTRTFLKDLGISLSNLVNAFPEVFIHDEIKTRLKDFQQVYQEAVQRLEHPSLCIATLGTTSSGKSTIVNALMGRRIAPIEAGEMSGGVLKLRHSQERKLIIESTPDAVWQTGEWTGLSDEELYRRTQEVMHTYHEARKKKDYIAPQITVDIPLLPACDLNLSCLPKGIGIEFLDLPGLKSVQDRTNLAIIQPQVGKAFSLVALDYMQVDEEHRQRLLSELKRVVEYLQGRTDSMIFILNRVDNRGSDDLPLEVRLAKLKEEIKQVLDLSKLPDVIPFNARLLYYAQCAWGTTPLNTSSTVTQEERAHLLKAFFRDCANTIEEKTEKDFELNDWFSNVKRTVKRDQPINDEIVREILRYAFKWSGGEALWHCIQVRVQESFSELVILPALLDVFTYFDVLSDVLNILIDSRQIYNQEQVEAERDKITKIRQELQKNIKKVDSNFQEEIKQLIEGLKNKDPKIRIKIKEDAEKKGRKGFSLIFQAINQVQADLTASLIHPVSNAFGSDEEEEVSCYDLENQLREVITPPLAKDIAKAYDHVSRRMKKFTSQSDSLYRQVRADDEKAVKELEHDERYVRLLYYTMRQAITARAEFALQTQEKMFTEALQSLVNDQIKRLKVCLYSQELSSINLEQAVISDVRQRLTQNLLFLPDNLFKITDTIEQRRQEKSEVVGTEIYYENVKKTKSENYTESYEEGSCFKTTKTRTRTRPVEYIDQEKRTRNKYENIEYTELLLPSPKLMSQQWSEGIEKEKDKLWNILCDLIIKRLDAVSEEFQESVINLTDLTESALNEQLKIIQFNFEEEKQFWINLQSYKNQVSQIRQKVEQEIK
ncbi:hypothetical protein C7H19_24525 [Aphanothece hegewaldii CCALA 016]|uniref:Dynamin N-terminal domain-containing protein n=1 Tax=Aphanothece hegewaldii CCALA 016 TaxID=2107694 RepID=A0A2T1LQW3_9CHRO|nr:dynamin family protein [Aphanothece hegewaldii]PSF28943.1 hypothetical protein C7H19_24525 [Aphanothece hegewaldii CCALA 016]